ncbi:MAG: hypothetical protein IPH88_04555 [Bacteroidales bacterium]|nr:hypothetical protein [Bacteroidales bacterium]
MQITIVSCTNDPPVIAALTDTCITAGNKLEFTVSATDSNLDKINLSAKGQPFLLNPDPADLTSTKDESGLTEGLFSWQTNCLQIRKDVLTSVLQGC